MKNNYADLYGTLIKVKKFDVRFKSKRYVNSCEKLVKCLSEVLFPHGQVSFSYENNMVLNVHVNYCVSRRIKDEWLDEILSAANPVLRLEHMDEVEPGANDFRLCSSDLVCDFIRCLDVEKVIRVYDYIQFEKYDDYPQKMLEELFVKSNLLAENCTEENVIKCVKILELFSEKGLKIPKAACYIKLVSENLPKCYKPNRIIELLSCLQV